MKELDKLKIIGIGGFARSGKDTFVKYAINILGENGYLAQRVAFADELKSDLYSFIKEKYGIDVFLASTEEKNLIRPLLVAHGCGMRLCGDGSHWIRLMEKTIKNSYDDLKYILDKPMIFLVSDVRFPNEADWIHDNGGWFVHIKKYEVYTGHDYNEYDPGDRIYDSAPNEEEAKQDPLIEKKADYKLEWETAKDLDMLKPIVKECLIKCPFLTIQNQ